MNYGKDFVKREIENLSHLLGATFTFPDEDIMRKLRIDHGIQIKSMENGPLKNAGIKTGYIITEVDHQKIQNISDLEAAVSASKGAILFEGFYPNGTRAFYAFGL